MSIDTSLQLYIYSMATLHSCISIDALHMTSCLTSCHDKYSYTYQHDETYQVDDKVFPD